MAKSALGYKNWFIKVFYIAAAVVFIYIVVTQFHSLKNSLKLISKSDRDDEIIAFLFVLVAFIAAAQSYIFLSFKKLLLSRTVIIEFAVTTINRILPSGVGGLGTNYVYLRKNDNSRIQATGMVAINNLLGFIANMALLGLVVLFVKSNPLSINRPNNRDLIIVGAIIAVFLILLASRLRKRIIKAIKNIIFELKSYRHRKENLAYSFISQISISLANVLALYFSLEAVHVHLSLSSVMLSYTFAIWVSTILPTPGGVGAVETSLTGALVAFGISFDTALSAVLIFRLLSFWLPFFLGGLSLIWARKHKYL